MLVFPHLRAPPVNPVLRTARRILLQRHSVGEEGGAVELDYSWKRRLAVCNTDIVLNGLTARLAVRLAVIKGLCDPGGVHFDVVIFFVQEQFGGSAGSQGS